MADDYSAVAEPVADTPKPASADYSAVAEPVSAPAAGSSSGYREVAQPVSEEEPTETISAAPDPSWWEKVKQEHPWVSKLFESPVPQGTLSPAYRDPEVKPSYSDIPERLVNDVVGSAIAPGNLALMATGMAAPAAVGRVITGGYAATMGYGLVKSAPGVYRVVTSPETTGPEKAMSASEFGLNALMTGTAAAHTAAPLLEKTAPEEYNMASLPEGAKTAEKTDTGAEPSPTPSAPENKPVLTPLPEGHQVTVMEMGGKKVTQIDIPDPERPGRMTSMSPEDALKAGYDVNHLYEGVAEPVSDEKVTAQIGQKIADYSRYQELQPLIKAGASEQVARANQGLGFTPEYQALIDENEEIKNRNPNEPGMPPSAPGVDLSEEGLAKAASPQPSVSESGDQPPHSIDELNANAARVFQARNDLAVVKEMGGTPQQIHDAQTKVWDLEEVELQARIRNNQWNEARDEGSSGSEPPQEPPNKEAVAAGAGDEAPNYGIAARVSAERAAAGKIAPVEPGEVATPEELIQHGRDMIDAGRDPQAVLKDVQDSKRFNSEDMAILRAHGEDLYQAANAAADKFGIDSEEYKAAKQADSDWVKNAIKPMQTDWSRSGAVQQGETEVDTGSFHGLARAYEEASGKAFTDQQASKAQDISSGVTKARTEADAAQQKLFDFMASVPTREVDTSAADVARRSNALETQIGSLEDQIKNYRVFPEGAKEQPTSPRIEELQSQLDALKERRENIRQELQPKGEKQPGVWDLAKMYLQQGEKNLTDIAQKISNDTGLSVDEVRTRLAAPKGAKALSDAMYTKMSARRNLEAGARDWLANQRMPGWQRVVAALPRAFFKMATAGHGTVWIVTHASPEIFKPQDWGQLWPNYINSFKLMGVHDGGAYHERMMQDLERDPNFIPARRAGLENDPSKRIDDYQKAWLGGWFGKLGLIGNRGFDGLKLLRQDLWNQQFDPSMSKDERAMLADGINHATGATSIRFREWMNWTFFAPKLAASQWQWMVADPAKAAKILGGWEKATDAEKSFAIRQIKEKATIAGVYATLLAANQALLKASGSKQSVNYTDPTRSDFLKFKAAGATVGVGSPLLGNVRLLTSLINSSMGNPAPYQKRMSTADQMATALADYGRSKFSPFASTVADVATRADFEGRPMPFSDDKVKPSLHKQGIYTRYGTAEYAATKLPIPVAEAIKDVWKHQGMDETTMDHWMTAITAGVVGGLTGARVSKDTNPTGK